VNRIGAGMQRVSAICCRSPKRDERTCCSAIMQMGSMLILHGRRILCGFVRWIPMELAEQEHHWGFGAARDPTAGRRLKHEVTPLYWNAHVPSTGTGLLPGTGEQTNVRLCPDNGCNPANCETA
jgi:hypothetical protein